MINLNGQNSSHLVLPMNEVPLHKRKVINSVNCEVERFWAQKWHTH